MYFQTDIISMQAQRADITELKEDVAKLVQALIPRGGN